MLELGLGLVVVGGGAAAPGPPAVAGAPPPEPAEDGPAPAAEGGGDAAPPAGPAPNGDLLLSKEDLRLLRGPCRARCQPRRLQPVEAVRGTPASLRDRGDAVVA